MIERMVNKAIGMWESSKNPEAGNIAFMTPVADTIVCAWARARARRLWRGGFALCVGVQAANRGGPPGRGLPFLAEQRLELGDVALLPPYHLTRPRELAAQAERLVAEADVLVLQIQ